MNKIGVITVVFVPLLLVSSALAIEEGPVWFWYSHCGGPSMVLEVTLDRKPILKASIPLCHGERTEGLNRNGAHVLKKRFKPPRAIVWSGFRHEPDRTAPGQQLQLTFSQPNAESDSVAILVNVAGGDRVYMAAVHVAHPDRRDDTEIAEGLVLSTYPRTMEDKTKDQ